MSGLMTLISSIMPSLVNSSSGSNNSSHASAIPTSPDKRNGHLMTPAAISPPIEVAYVPELTTKVEDVASTQGTVSPTMVAREVEATQHYLVMLGAVRSIEYCIYLRRIQGAFGWDDNGDPRKDLGMSGWPKGKTFLDLLDDPKVKNLKIPPTIINKYKAYYKERVAQLERDAADTSDAEKAAKAKERLGHYKDYPFTVWVDFYNHFTREVLMQYFTEIFGTGAVGAKSKDEYALFDRLSYLNSKLPSGKQLDLPSLTFPIEGAAPGELSYATLDVAALAGKLETLNADRAGLTTTEQNILDEMMVISMLITVEYMRAVRRVQTNVGKFMDSGDNWPTSGRNETKWSALVEEAAKKGIIDNGMKDNMLYLQNKKLSFDTSYQNERFNKTYVYYARPFKSLYTMIVTDAAGKRRDPLSIIQDINDKEICSILATPKVDPLKTPFNETAFFGEVLEKVTVANTYMMSCIAKKAGEVTTKMDERLWQETKPRWMKYIERVYLALGVQLSAVQSRDGRTGLEVLDDLLEKGYRDPNNRHGIFPDDVKDLTQFVELRRTGVPLTDWAYSEAAKSIHENLDVVTEDIFYKTTTMGRKKLKNRNQLEGLAIIRKLDAAGIKVPGLYVQRGRKISDR